MLCRTGLPDLAGRRPSRVTTETELPLISAAELSAVVSTRADELDEEASGQEGLRQVVAAALSDPDLPLAIYLGDSYIFKPPGEGLQCLLLWGLRRIIWPVFGDAGRGWSFSTFEPPRGDLGHALLPDILFLQAQDARPTGLAARTTREEIESRPLGPSGPNDEGLHARLADWLVAEYRRPHCETIKIYMACKRQ
jgi:hypothetical protein